MKLSILCLGYLVMSVQVPGIIPTSNIPKLNSYIIKRLKTPITGGMYTCFLVDLTVQDKNFKVMIDTGSTDTVLPYSTINQYNGPTIDFPIDSNSTLKTKRYGDKSFWNGYIINIPVRLSNTNITAISPVAMITNQSSEPAFINGQPTQGLIGLGFKALSSSKDSPYSLPDSWFQSGQIPKNQFAFHGCPYSKENQSWIDFGNETPYIGCGDEMVYVKIPKQTFFTLDIHDFLINGQIVDKPTQFQTEGVFDQYSVLDSCTSLIYLPKIIITNLVTQMIASGGFHQKLIGSHYFQNWIEGTVSVKLKHKVNFDLLPNIGFQIATGRPDYEYVTLTIGPRQYIQIDIDGYYSMAVVQGNDQRALLGLAFFSSFYILLDKNLGEIGFRLGCNCHDSVDGFPKVIKSAPKKSFSRRKWFQGS
jgi:hypothetical protein